MGILPTSVVMADPTRREGVSVLLLIGEEPFWPLLRMFRLKNKPLSWQRPMALAVGKFFAWLSENGHQYREIGRRDQLFTSFADDLLFGTIDEAGNDHSGLYWQPVTQHQCRNTLRCILTFADWLADKYGVWHFNPWAERADYVDQVLFWRSWSTTKSQSLLNHIKVSSSVPTDRIGRTYPIPGNISKPIGDAKAFPLEHIRDLLLHGFETTPNLSSGHPQKITNYRDLLIALLCLYGGLRISEALHLWVTDVYENPNNKGVARVLIFHPSDGIFIDPISKKKYTRAEYLLNVCNGQKPLNQRHGRQRAGWKGALLTEPHLNAFRVFWIEEFAGKLFLDIWDKYMLEVRVRNSNHDLRVPWAFLNRNGVPLGTLMYWDSFNLALNRIGLDHSKIEGLSPHGLRHRYGRWCADKELDIKTVQYMMHHLHPSSQEVYKGITPKKIEEKLRGKSIGLACLESSDFNLRETQ